MNKFGMSAALLLAAGSWAAAQQPFTVQTTPAGRPMQLDVVVTDQAGKPVAGLQQQDFKVLDNGQERPITAFRGYSMTAPPPSPAEVVIVLDGVNMDAQQQAQAREGIERYLHENGGHLTYFSEVFVVEDQGIKGEQLTNDGNALAKKLEDIQNEVRSLTPSSGGWGEIDRFKISMQAVQLLAQNLAQRPGKKLMLWVGPSWPLMDQIKIQPTDKGRESQFAAIVKFSDLFRTGQITFYSVSLGAPDMRSSLYTGYVKPVRRADQSYPGDVNGKVFAVQTGGLVLGPDNDLTQQIDRCVQDAGAYYTLTFNAPRADGRDDYHPLQVVVDKPGLKARTTTGYYDQP